MPDLQRENVGLPGLVSLWMTDDEFFTLDSLPSVFRAFCRTLRNEDGLTQEGREHYAEMLRQTADLLQSKVA